MMIKITKINLMLRDRKHRNKQGKEIVKDIYAMLDYAEIIIHIHELNELRRDIAMLHGCKSADVRFEYVEEK
jgi:hypothetical protein